MSVKHVGSFVNGRMEEYYLVAPGATLSVVFFVHAGQDSRLVDTKHAVADGTTVTRTCHAHIVPTQEADGSNRPFTEARASRSTRGLTHPSNDGARAGKPILRLPTDDGRCATNPSHKLCEAIIAKSEWTRDSLGGVINVCAACDPWACFDKRGGVPPWLHQGNLATLKKRGNCSWITCYTSVAKNKMLERTARYNFCVCYHMTVERSEQERVDA